MILYIKVTKDKFELPVAVADSVIELAEMTGTTKNTIYSTMSHLKEGRIKWSAYQKVEVEE